MTNNIRSTWLDLSAIFATRLSPHAVYCIHTGGSTLTNTYIATICSMFLYYLAIGTASITNHVATVILEGLTCGVVYNIIAGGKLNGDLVGPRSSHGIFTADPCPEMSSTILPTTTTILPTVTTLPNTCKDTAYLSCIMDYASIFYLHMYLLVNRSKNEIIYYVMYRMHAWFKAFIANY